MIEKIAYGGDKMIEDYARNNVFLFENCLESIEVSTFNKVNRITNKCDPFLDLISVGNKSNK